MHVAVFRGDVEIPDHRQLGVIGQFRLQVIPQLGQPGEFVGIFVAAHGLPIGHIQVHQPQRADGAGQHALLRILEARQAGAHRADRQAAEHRDAVIGRLAGVNRLIAGRAQRLDRKLGVDQLGFLQGQHLHGVLPQPVQHMREPHVE